MSVDVGALTGRTVKPGERVALTAEIDAGLSEGARRESMTVLLDNGAVHSFRIKAHSVATYAVRPEMVDFGDVDITSDEAAVTSVVLFQSDQSVIKSVRSDSSWFEVTAHESANGEQRVYAQVRPLDLILGASTGRIVFETDDVYRSTYSILVKAVGTASLRTNPGHVFLRPNEARRVGVFDSAGNAVAIAKVDCAPHSSAVQLDGSGTAIVVGPFSGADVRFLRVTIHDAANRRGRFFATILK
jgi:hypothetical protein